MDLGSSRYPRERDVLSWRNRQTKPDIHYLYSFIPWQLLLIHNNISPLSQDSASESFLTQHSGNDFQPIQASLQDKSDLTFWGLKQDARSLMNKRLKWTGFKEGVSHRGQFRTLMGPLWEMPAQGTVGDCRYQSLWQWDGWALVEHGTLWDCLPMGSQVCFLSITVTEKRVASGQCGKSLSFTH